MPPEKRNQFLDAEDSNDEESQGYESEEEELQKGSRRAPGRNEEEEEASEGGNQAGDDPQPSQEVQLNGEAKAGDPKQLPELARPLAKKNLVATEQAIRKSGVIYISRVPPFLKPQKLRSLLEPFGKINRIFLSPDTRPRTNKRRSYTDGWVEFVDKKEARMACEYLRGRTVGGKKGSRYRDDVWNLVYLKGLKWRDITEQIAAENAERTSRMRAEISKTTKENKEFVRNVELAKKLEGMQSKAAAKRKKASDDDGGDDGDAEMSAQQRKRTFRQIPLAEKKESEKQPEWVNRVLGKIF